MTDRQTYIQIFERAYFLFDKILYPASDEYGFSTVGERNPDPYRPLHFDRDQDQDCYSALAMKFAKSKKNWRAELRIRILYFLRNVSWSRIPRKYVAIDFFFNISFYERILNPGFVFLWGLDPLATLLEREEGKTLIYRRISFLESCVQSITCDW